MCGAVQYNHEGEWIQGLVAHKDDETRVYAITIEPEPGAIHDRWPKILR